MWKKYDGPSTTGPTLTPSYTHSDGACLHRSSGTADWSVVDIEGRLCSSGERTVLGALASALVRSEFERRVNESIPSRPFPQRLTSQQILSAMDDYRAGGLP